MFSWSAMLLVLTLAAAGLGFWAFVGQAAMVARFLFFVFLALLVLRVALRVLRGERAPMEQTSIMDRRNF